MTRYRIRGGDVVNDNSRLAGPQHHGVPAASSGKREVIKLIEVAVS
jgi:hypothetical protein